MDRQQSFLKNVSYTLVTNLLTAIVSILLVTILPMLIGVEDYGYWQLYIFYIGYAGFFHLGWVDGIYLKYGGMEYDALNKQRFLTQFWMLFTFEIVVAIGISAYTYLHITDNQNQFILLTTCVGGFLTVMRTFILYVLQMTARIKTYAIISITDRALYLGIIVLLLTCGVRSFSILILADIFARLTSLALATAYCRDIIFGKIVLIKDGIKEAVDNVNVGVKLMAANIAGLLIIGIVRFSINDAWDIATFGKVSLSLSVSNLIMMFISAISVILFPMLRRTDRKNIKNIYRISRTILMTILILLMIVYYPAKAILSVWLPMYDESLRYMALMFPICIYESKSNLLITTYLKTLRKEKTILLANSIAVVLSLIVTGFTVYAFHNLELAVASVVLLIAFKSIFSELLLSRAMEMDVKKDIILEILMSLVFILCAWYVPNVFSILSYLVAYIGYLYIKRNDITEARLFITVHLKKTNLK